MKNIAHKKTAYGLFLTALLIWTAGSAKGVVLHPNGEPNLATWTDRPDNDAVGRWGYIASCVAVSSNCIITAQHPSGNLNTPVSIGGKAYTIAQIWNHSTADLRVVKLYGANLANFVDIYENTNEVGKNIVMGGYGKGRGNSLQTGGVTYGYEWDGSNNSTLRFGTNKINYTLNNRLLLGLISNVIVADFDGLGEGMSTAYEGAAGNYDSGCGWFIKDNGIWKVAGLCRAVEGHSGQSWFRDCNDPNILDPDYLDAVRISSYATWINETIPQRLQGELTGDDWIDFADFAVFASYWLNTDCHYPDWCQGADSEPDGDVDWDDLAEFAYNWLTSEP